MLLILRGGTENQTVQLGKSFCLHIFSLATCVVHPSSVWTREGAKDDNKNDQGITVVRYQEHLNTWGLFTLEKRWLRRIWQTSLKSWVAERMWLHSAFISNSRAERLGMNPAGRALHQGWDMEHAASSWFISKAFSMQDLSTFVPTSCLEALAKDPLHVPWGHQLA